jgi:hypothetical protein
MSNFRAIASVTATLQYLLQQAINADVPGAMATIVRPDEGAAGLPDIGVNVFLYQVAPNGAFRNEDLPTRSADGGRIQRSRVGVDLHYLLTFYGSDTKFERQMVLGTTLRELHAKAVLTGELIGEALGANPPLLLPPAAASDLAAEVERVKLTQIPLTLEELSKLWSILLQTPYQLSVAYQGAAVLLESEDMYATALPVRTRNVYVETLRAPMVEAVLASSGDSDPILDGATVRIRGKNFSGDAGPDVVVDGTPAPLVPGTSTDTELDAVLPPLLAGVHGLVVKRELPMGTPPANHKGWQSSVFPFVLTPKIDPLGGGYNIVVSAQSSRTVGTQTYDSADLTIRFHPAAGTDQRVALVLNHLTAEGQAYTFDVKPGTTSGATQVTIRAVDVIPGPYLVRLRIDNAMTPLDFTAGSYSGPQVTL